MSKPVTRRTGAASEWKQRSVTRATISEATLAKPGGLGDDDRAAGRADRRADGRVVERHDRAQVDDLEAAALLGGDLGGLERDRHGRAVGDEGRVGALAAHDGPCRCRRTGCGEVDLVLGPVELLRLEEDHRVRRGDRLRAAARRRRRAFAGATTCRPGVCA